MNQSTNNIISQKTAVAYCRYSSELQREESIEAQIRAIEDFCERNGIKLLRTYIDRAMSGTNDNRPEFLQMVEDSKAGLFDTVIVHKLDRFSRDRYDSAIYRKKLKDNNVQLISVLENFDNSPESVILESVLEGMNEYYSKNLSREVKKGHHENALKCKHNGGRPALGYDINSEGYYAINEIEAESVRIIFDMYTKGYGYSDIIDTLNNRGYKTKAGRDFGKNSLYEILGNKRYIGTFAFGSGKMRVEIEDGMPAIVDKKTFDKVAEMRNRNKRSYARYANRTYLLSGLLYCGQCGKPIYGDAMCSHGREYLYYTCSGRKNKTCNSKRINGHDLEKAVLEAFEKQIFTKENEKVIIENIYKYINDDLGPSEIEYKKEIKIVDGQIETLINEIMNGLATDSMRQKVKDLEERKSKLKVEMIKAKTNTEKMSREEIKIFVQKYKDLSNLPCVEKREILNFYIDRITVQGSNINILLNMYTFSDNDWCGREETSRSQKIITVNIAA